MIQFICALANSQETMEEILPDTTAKRLGIKKMTLEYFISGDNKPTYRMECFYSDEGKLIADTSYEGETISNIRHFEYDNQGRFIEFSGSSYYLDDSTQYYGKFIYKKNKIKYKASWGEYTYYLKNGKKISMKYKSKTFKSKSEYIYVDDQIEKIYESRDGLVIGMTEMNYRNDGRLLKSTHFTMRMDLTEGFFCDYSSEQHFHYDERGLITKISNKTEYHDIELSNSNSYDKISYEFRD